MASHNPSIRRTSLTSRWQEESLLKPGEFILGFENEYGTHSVCRCRKFPPHEILLTTSLPPDPKARSLAGIRPQRYVYLVFRKLSQDVEGFSRSLLLRTSKRVDRNGGS